MKEFGLRKHNTAKEVGLRCILQVLPATLVVMYLFYVASLQESLFAGRHVYLALVFALGMMGAQMVYQTRLRFIPSFIAVVGLGILVYGILRNTSGAELTPFFRAHQFQLYYAVFAIGWAVSFGVIRLRYFPIVFSIIIAALAGWLQVHLPESEWKHLAWYFIPVILFGLYFIFISEQLRDYHTYGSKRAFPMLFNSLAFMLIAVAAACIFLWGYRQQINKTVEDIVQGKFLEKNSMLQRHEDGASIRRSGSLSSSNNRENELLLAVYINNFFEGTEVPNPLYLTAFYYNHFDTATETFTTSEENWDEDLIKVDLACIPLYQTYTDSSVLEFTGINPSLHVVEIEVYNRAMRFTEFVAPTTAFSVQPIAVDPEFQGEYKSAYTAKSMVSHLNSAYFVYNANNPQARTFQEARYQILRSVEDFSAMDEQAYARYTQLPDVDNLKEVRALAQKITAGMELPIDKIIAIKDYFLSKDEQGNPLFRYSDNPGIPDIPSAKSLNYFLFENRKGFCAHYAGATLFMLRSLGIPSRIAAGFLVEDRSTANPGWYFLYADQVHAWVQVYFPGFGWLDFDTTIGNDEARESDQPDPTPPLQPKKAKMTFTGWIEEINTTNSVVHLQSHRAVLLSKNFVADTTVKVRVDLSAARILYDTAQIRFEQLSVGDTLTTIVFQKNEDDVQPLAVQSLEELVQKSDSIIMADLVQVLVQKRTEDTVVTPTDTPNISLRSILRISLIVLVVLLGLLQVFPIALDYYYALRSRSKDLKEAAYFNYLRIFYQTWMLRFYKSSRETWQTFSQRADARLNTRLAEFLAAYYKLKYSNHSLTNEEEKLLRSYAQVFVLKMKEYIPVGKRFKYWLHVRNAFRYVMGRKELK